MLWHLTKLLTGEQLNLWALMQVTLKSALFEPMHHIHFHGKLNMVRMCGCEAVLVLSDLQTFTLVGFKENSTALGNYPFHLKSLCNIENTEELLFWPRPRYCVTMHTRVAPLCLLQQWQWLYSVGPNEISPPPQIPFYFFPNFVFVFVFIFIYWNSIFMLILPLASVCY